VCESPPQNASPSGASHKEELLAAGFILFTSGSFFLTQYNRMRTVGPGLDQWVRAMLSGAYPAPEQYRIAVPYLLDFLSRHTSLKPAQSLPLIEFLCYASALTLLYLLFRGSSRVQSSPYAHRLVLLGLFLAAIQFPILWIFPWERPETLPTTFYLAAIVFLVVHRSRMPFALACLFTVLLSLFQALMRADVPVVIGIAILVAAAMGISLNRPRSSIAILGGLCSVAGGGAQLLLQHVIYPTAAYSSSTRKIQLLTNLNPIQPPLHIPIFLTALLPLIASLFLVRRQASSLEPSDKLVLLACLLYLPVWVIVGLVSEVRIFVPFLFLASATIAKIWTAYLFGDDHGTQGS